MSFNYPNAAQLKVRIEGQRQMAFIRQEVEKGTLFEQKGFVENLHNKNKRTDSTDSMPTPTTEQREEDTEVKSKIREDINVMNENFGEPIYFMSISITESQNRGTPHKHSMILDEMSKDLIWRACSIFL